MINPTAPQPSVARYTTPLRGAVDELAHIRSMPLDSPVRHDLALMHLGRISGSIHDALAHASVLPASIPSGATSFARDAAGLVRRAADEVLRASEGLSFDIPVIRSSAQGAIDRLTSAVRLVTSPPSTQVFDGS